jgi:hypothetical protein
MTPLSGFELRVLSFELRVQKPDTINLSIFTKKSPLLHDKGLF